MIDEQQCVLGSMLIHPPACDDVETIVSAEDFDRPFDAVFAFMLDAYRAGKPLGDIRWVYSELKQRHLLDAIGGAAGLAAIGDSVGHAAHARAYAQQVRAAADRRRLKATAQAMLKAADDSSRSPAEVAAEYGSRLSTVATTDASTLTSWSYAAAQALERMEQAAKGREAARARWGIFSLDETTGGLFAGELVIVAARPSIGKSSLCAQIAVHNATRERGVLYVSLEMEPVDIVGRQIAAEVGVELRAIRSGRVYAAQLAEARQYVADAENMSLAFQFGRSLTVANIRAAARLQASRPEGLALIVLDYIGLVSAAKEDRSKPRWEQVGAISSELKGLAMELGCPLVAACQLGREAERESPTLAHLRDSGAIEQDADVVILLHRETKESTTANLTIAKNRNGVCGSLGLSFDPARTRFDDSTPRYVFE